MWLMTNQGFLSIVQPEARDLREFNVSMPDVLMVRARAAGHIEAAFPNLTVEVFVEPTRDYLYRAFIPRAAVVKAVAEQVAQLDYPNFKNSVEDDPLHNAYARVWTVMHNYQTQQAPKRPMRAGRPK